MITTDSLPGCALLDFGSLIYSFLTVFQGEFKSMSTQVTFCPKCNGEMQQGFVADTRPVDAFVSFWTAGHPRRGFFGLKLPNRTPIATFRCQACGFLESYAKPEFDAK